MIGLSACQTEKQEPPTSIKLAGQIENAPEAIVIISHGEQRDTLSLENGRFSGEIKLDEAGKLRLSNGKESTQFYAVPGDSLHVYLDYNEFDESIKYTGTAPDASAMLAQLYLNKEALNKQWSTSEKYMLDVDKFISLEDSIRKSRMEFLGIYRDRIPKALLEGQEMEFTYEYARNVAMYPEYAAWFQKNDSIQLPENWASYFEGIELENEAALDQLMYERYVESKIQENTREKIEQLELDPDGEDYMKMMMESANELLSKPKVKAHFMANLLQQTIDFYGTKDLSEHFRLYEENNNDSARLAELNAEYAAWNHLYDGKPAPDFTYTSIKGDTVSLSDFMGKVVYVDVWATWCGPCLGEIPDLQALEEEMHDKDVVFISVSVDDSVSDWEDMVTTDELGGIQLATRSGWKSEITDDYMIKGIPRFILVDREGNLVSADAPRPSSGDEIRTKIEEALNSGTAMAVKD